MTQMDTLLTARAQPSPTLHRKPDTDAQSDQAAQFVEVWSVQADEAVAKNAAQFLIRDSLPDADVAKTALATPPENTQTPVPQSQSKHDVLHLQVTGPAAPNDEIPGVQNDAAQKAAPDNTVQGAVPKTELHSLQTSREGGNWTAEKPAKPEQIKTAPQLPNPQHPLLSVDKKTPIAAPDTRQNARQSLWSVAAPSQRDPIALPKPAPIVIAPTLATLPMPDPAILGDELTGPDLGAPPVSQSGMTTSAAATTALQRAYAPHVAHQIATAIVQTLGATTEIALNPEELGRVRISVTAGDAGLTVAIIAERPETMDLMRRNIDLLTRELREMGYENPTFTFGDQSGDADQDQGDGAVQSGAASDPSTADEHPQTSMRVALSGGLDLKL
jgi:flagellar hook-length control protein FliK